MHSLGLVLANASVATGRASCEDLLEMAEEADSNASWEYVWVGDSMLSVPRLESLVLLSACAARTSRIKLGVACEASLGFRNALVFAIQWMSLDLLSGGRMTLVACPGTGRTEPAKAELATFGMEFRQKVERMDDAISILRLASTGQGIDYHGKHWNISAVTPRPLSVQRPVPIWLAANPPANESPTGVERALARVARLADGWMTFAVPPDVLRVRITRLAALRSELGSDATPFPICAYLDVNVHEDRDRAMEDAIDCCRSEGRRNASRETLAATAAVGSPDDCLKVIDGLVGAGVSDLALRPVSQRPREQFARLNKLLVPELTKLNWKTSER